MALPCTSSLPLTVRDLPAVLIFVHTPAISWSPLSLSPSLSNILMCTSDGCSYLNYRSCSPCFGMRALSLSSLLLSHTFSLPPSYPLLSLSPFPLSFSLAPSTSLSLCLSVSSFSPSPPTTPPLSLYRSGGGEESMWIAVYTCIFLLEPI